MTAGIRQRYRLAILGAAFGAVAACGPAPDDESFETPSGDPYAADPVNLDVWLERLEVGSRELYSSRETVAAALELEPGARVADIGAGTGLYTLLFAEKVGPDGVVYAVDIAPRFLTLINQRADDLGLEGVVSVLGRTDSITLPAESVDVVFIADTYHYFDEPSAMMRSIHEALRPGGRLYVVDFDLDENGPPPADHRHVRFGKEDLAAEIVAFGFEPPEEVAVRGLVENYMLRFRRP